MRLINNHTERLFKLKCDLEIDRIKNVILLLPDNNCNRIRNYNIEVEGDNNKYYLNDEDNVFLYNIKSHFHTLNISNISFLI